MNDRHQTDTQRQFLLFDDRAAGGDGTSDASVLVSCDSNAEALDYRGEYGGMACYSYAVEVIPGKKIESLVDEKFEWNWFPGDPL